MNWSQHRHGRQSATRKGQAATDHVADLWRIARDLNHDIDRPKPEGSEWVPTTCIWLRDGVSPRGDNYPTNPEVVERYKGVFYDLPPIRVQKDTFALIDGAHRLTAADAASSAHILIIEEDVPDEVLPLLAFKANQTHGLAYDVKARAKGVLTLLRHEPYSGYTDNWFVKHLAVGHETVTRARAKLAKEAETLAAGEAPEGDEEATSFAPAKQPLPPLKRVGANGKKYSATQPRTGRSEAAKVDALAARQAPATKAKGFDPDAAQEEWVDAEEETETEHADTVTGDIIRLKPSTEGDQFTHLHDGFEVSVTWNLYGPPTEKMLRDTVLAGLAQAHEFLDTVGETLFPNG